MLAQKLFLKTLEEIRFGRLTLVDSSGSHEFGDPHAGVAATLIVSNPRFFSRVVFGGDDGAGDSYVDGDWWSPDLVSLVRVVVKNMDRIANGNRLFGTVSRLAFRLRHKLRNNTVAGSRRNIAEHYDLSNDFFRLFLDQDMVYSSAVFESEGQSLESAQRHKIDLLCRKLDLGPGDEVLEIGTGWGAFAWHAAVNYGCHITTTTISQQQHDVARERFSHLAGNSGRVDLLLQDYRLLRGRFDKIVSIEMFEAVGLDHYDEFFGACDRLLNPNGIVAMQAITMNERRFPSYHRNSDWIQRRIFPGAELACLSEILRSIGRATSLTLVHAEDIGLHYAVTLAEWRRRFLDAKWEVLNLGFDERFARMWDYYLAYCEGAFRERYIGNSQLVFSKIYSTRLLWTDPKAENRETTQLESVG